MIKSSPIVLTLTLMSGSLTIGCAADGDDPEPMAAGSGSTGGAEPGDSTGGEGTTVGAADSTDGGSSGESTGVDIDIDALYDCEDPDIMLVPMVGPGIDPDTGEWIGPPQDTYIGHSTQILVKPEAMEEFDAMMVEIGAQLMQSEGVLGVGFAIEPNCGFLRTMGVWQDELSMYAFVGSGAHVEAMGKTTQIAITTRTTSWEMEAEQMPLTWEVALDAIDEVEPSPIFD